jgi:hypothetical protein
MVSNRTRLAGWALIVGTVVATVGYLAANTLTGSGDARFTNSLWTPLNSLAIAGDLIMVLGLPAILAVHGHRAAKLTLVGYVGLFAALVMLNVSEGCIEAYIKPYLVHHGGIPADAPGGFAIFDDVALVMLLVGLICLGIAVIRARVLGWWVGALFIASPLLSFVGLSGPFALISDYLAFVAIFTIGVKAVRLSEGPTAQALGADTAVRVAA